jgi:hypothetical protein
MGGVNSLLSSRPPAACRRNRTLPARSEAKPQLALFGEEVHPAVAALADLHLETLTPEQALAALQRLKELR